MLYNIAGLLLGCIVGLIGGYIFIGIITIEKTKERLANLWKLLAYFCGASVPGILMPLASKKNDCLAWYIIGVGIVFLSHYIIVAIQGLINKEEN